MRREVTGLERSGRCLTFLSGEFDGGGGCHLAGEWLHTWTHDVKKEMNSPGNPTPRESYADAVARVERKDAELRR